MKVFLSRMRDENDQTDYKSDEEWHHAISGNNHSNYCERMLFGTHTEVNGGGHVLTCMVGGSGELSRI